MSCGGVKVWYNFYINQFALITQAEREDDFYETQEFGKSCCVEPHFKHGCVWYGIC